MPVHVGTNLRGGPCRYPPLPKMEKDLETPITSAPSKNWKRTALIGAIATITITTVLWYWWPRSSGENSKAKTETSDTLKPTLNSVKASKNTQPLESNDWCESFFKREASTSSKRYSEFTVDDWFSLLNYYTKKRAKIFTFKMSMLKDVAAIEKLTIQRDKDKSGKSKAVHPFVLEVACRTEPTTHEALKTILEDVNLDKAALEEQTCVCLLELIESSPLDALCENKFITDEEINQIAIERSITPFAIAIAAFKNDRKNLFSTVLPEIEESSWIQILMGIFYSTSDSPVRKEMVQDAMDFFTSDPKRFEALKGVLSKTKFNPLQYLFNLARNKNNLNIEYYEQLFSGEITAAGFVFAEIIHASLLKKFNESE